MSYSGDTIEKISVEFSPLSTISGLPKSVDVWLLDLSAITPANGEKFSRIMSGDEQARAQQFKRDRHHFLATRALLRKSLSLYTNIPPQQLSFSRTAQGKPFLNDIPEPLYFNLTHSGQFAALAVGARGEVGVDIETLRKRSYLKIVERFFHKNEITQLHQCDKDREEQLFFRLWTLKEAFFKATGTGISTGLEKAWFDLEKGYIDAHFAPELNVHKDEWQFVQEFVAPKTIVALALNTLEKMQHQWFDGNVLLADQ